MKKIFVVIITAFALQAAQAQVSKATLTASGLTCSMCSKAIYTALLKVNTIESIKANIKESSYNIVFKKDAAVSFDEIRNAVEEAGFSVANLKATVAFDNAAVKNDAHITVAGLNLHFLNVPEETLNGEKVLTIIDKDFVPEKEYKKYSQYTTMKCFTTGMDDAGQRIYHVTII